MKIDYDIIIEEGQKFEIDRFSTEDAKGISHLFYAVYGPDYPIGTYYIPEKIIEENNKGNIYSIVARTPGGDIIGHGAIYRSSPVCKNLYEIGQYIVLPSYRKSFAAFKINAYIFENLIKTLDIEGLFGEAVTNHIMSQKVVSVSGMKDVGMEIDLMPDKAYDKEKSASGRVSCLIVYSSIKDRFQEVFIPEIYKEEINYILSDLDINRKINYSKDKIPEGIKTDISINFFAHAGVGRFNLSMAGSDFENLAEELEEKGKNDNINVFQYFINIEKPWTEEVIEILRKKGYFFGGYIPQWFNSDSILMQKIQKEPDFKSIKLYTKKAKRILELIVKDRESVMHNG